MFTLDRPPDTSASSESLVAASERKEVPIEFSRNDYPKYNHSNTNCNQHYGVQSVGFESYDAISALKEGFKQFTKRNIGMLATKERVNGTIRNVTGTSPPNFPVVTKMQI
eukprot:3175304-Amphidinium_carterae.1